MKKSLFAVLCALCLMAFSAQAQNSSEPERFRVGPTAVLALSTTNLAASHAAVFGFNLGALATYGLGSGMYVESGLLFAGKGVKWTYEGDRCNPIYLDIPVNFGYEIPVGEGINAFAEAGLYFGFGIGGKMYDGGTGRSWSYWNTTWENSWYSGGTTNRFELGVGLALGVEIFNGLQIRLGYNAGLTKINTLSNSARSYDTYTLGVAWMFL